MFRKILTRKYWNAIMLLTQISIARRDGNTFLGSLWSLIQPFLQITVIAFFMGFLLKFETKILVTNMVGALPFWNFIIQSVIGASNSLKSNSVVLKRVLLPKTYFPVSDVVSSCYTLLYSFIAMYCSIFFLFPELVTWKVIFIPILTIPLIISVMTISVVFAYTTPYIQDIPSFLTVILGVIYWTVPIVYPYSLVPESQKIFFELNPFYILIKPMQDIVINGELPSLFLIGKSWLVCIITFIISYFIYTKIARNVIYYL
jgi:lipopolysaccharide transport system permease protein